MKNLVVLFLGCVSFFYMLNIGAGFIEIIPDNFPLLGNLDEAGAATLFVASLRYFGLDVTKVFERDTRNSNIIEY